MMKLKLLVTGANGQLGSCLKELAPYCPHTFIFTDIPELDITSVDSVRSILNKELPDFVINCAAYTAVDRAEYEEGFARQLNAIAVQILADETIKVGAGIVQISTDYVFKGDSPTPRNENDPTDPVSVYGITKLEGERYAAKNPKHIIIRTSWLYSIYGNNFVKTICKLGAEKTEINVVCDQWGTPTSAHDLAKAILIAVEKPVYGTFHFSNRGVVSWAFFAEKIMHLNNLICKVNHITSDKYPTSAKRPTYSLMDKSKFSNSFSFVIQEWEDALKDMMLKRIKY